MHSSKYIVCIAVSLVMCGCATEAPDPFDLAYRANVDRGTKKTPPTPAAVTADKQPEIALSSVIKKIDLPISPAPLKKLPIVPADPVWTLKVGRTIGQELQAWGETAGWKVIWSFPKDWSVPSTTTFQGDFKTAASAVIQTLALNGALVRAQFYDGNKTMIVIGPGTVVQ